MSFEIFLLNLQSNMSIRITITTILLLSASIISVAQEQTDSARETEAILALARKGHGHPFTDGLTHSWQFQGAWNNGEGAPSQQYTLNFGTLNTASSTGYWRRILKRDIHADDRRVWGYGFGYDRMTNYGNGSNDRVLNQLYFDGRYRGAVLTVGMKEQLEDLGLGRMPLWQIRFSTHGYQKIFGFRSQTSGLYFKANAAYGLTNGQSWNQIFLDRPHEGFHEKQGISGGVTLRYGSPLTFKDRRKSGLTVESGIQTGFGGRDDWEGFYRWSSTLTYSTHVYSLSIFNTVFWGKVSCLWSPLYLAGTDFQGVALTVNNPVSETTKRHTPLFIVSLSQSRLKSIMASIAGSTHEVCIPEFCIDYNIRYSYRPITIQPMDPDKSLHNNAYVDSDIRHGLYASVSYMVPYVKGIYLDVAYAWDINKTTTDKKGVQVMLSWKRDLQNLLKHK